MITDETMMDLDWIVNPTDKQIFLNNYLERKPLVVKRVNKKYFENLITIKDIDYLISQGRTLGSFNIRLVGSETMPDPDEYYVTKKIHNINQRTGIDIKKVLNLFDQDKKTIVIEDVTSVWQPLKKLAINLNTDFHMCSTGANLYITPCQAQGFNAHYDTHDVFVLQVFGKKRWKVYDNPVVLPLGPQHSMAFDKTKLKLLYEVELEEGDTLYIPRGFVHEAVTSESISAHVTISLYITTWTRVLIDYIKSLGLEEYDFRRDFNWESLRTQDNCEKVLLSIKQKILNCLTIENLEEISEKYLNNKYQQPSLETLSQDNNH